MSDAAQELKILFLCTGNSCRSQMAEGWARHLLSDQIEPYSAGIEAHGMNANAVRVMREAGVDIASLYQYFSGKEAILYTLAEAWIQDVQAVYARHQALILAGQPDVPELIPNVPLPKVPFVVAIITCGAMFFWFL
mgnify:CR=1 FL=1